MDNKKLKSKIEKSRKAVDVAKARFAANQTDKNYNTLRDRMLSHQLLLELSGLAQL